MCVDRKCKACGNETFKRANGEWAKFCGPGCSGAYSATLFRQQHKSDVKKCERCLREFIPRGAGQKFCSPGCRYEPAKGIWNCLNCGESFTRTNKRGPRGNYCCNLCYRRHREGVACLSGGRISQSCAYCKAEWVGAHKRKYCSRECRERACRFAENRFCAFCKTPFTAKSRAAKCCSGSCAQNHRNSQRPMRSCTQCGGQFRKKSGINSAGLFCCRECCFEWKRSHSGHAVSYPVPVTNGSTHRRRAKKFGVRYEQINATSIYKRDKWMCGLCGTPVDRMAVHPQPEAATLDHIIPMSKGGAHTKDNVQCAHWRCNLMKSNTCRHPGGIALAGR